jgi:hypothetical protein
MMKYLKKNQKQIMAIFSVGLMIAFALPSAVSKYSGKGDAFGSIGSNKVTNQDIENAKKQWDLLSHQYERFRDPGTGQFRSEALTNHLVGPQIADDIEKHPEIFYLLRREAAQMGITASHDEIQELIANRDNENSEPVADSDLATAMESYVMMRNAWRQAISAMQFSNPQVRDELSKAQQISVNVVEFKAADFLQQLPPWTAQERAAAIDAQYEAYKDKLPDAETTNDFRFGYRLPNQVQIQYLQVPIDAIKKQVTLGIHEDDVWKFFLLHPDLFPATEPTSAPTAAASKPAVATTQQSFKDYRQKAHDLLTDDLAQKQAAAIVSDITTQMNGDYAEFKRAMGDHLTSRATTLPTSAPTPPGSKFGVAYNSSDYLHALAQHEQEEFKVLPVVTEELGLRSADDLKKTDIGRSMVGGFDLQELLRATNNNYALVQYLLAQRSFPTYVTTYVAAFATDAQEQQAHSQQLPTPGLLEPSPVLQDQSGNAFVFRAVQAAPSHSASKDAVYQQALDDARLKAAYQMARGHADKFIADSKTAYLQQTATTAKKRLFTTNFFSLNNPVIGGYTLPQGTTPTIFARAAFGLLAMGETGSHPKGVIDLKPTATALAGEINGVQPRWDARNFPTYELEVRLAMLNEQQQNLLRSWFNFDDIERRMNFQPANAEKKGPNPSPDQEQQPPHNPLTP